MYLVFSKKVCFLLPICLPCVICGSLWVVCNEDKCCVVMQHAADIRVAWLVHLECLHSHILRAYCNLNQNKQTWLLYLGDAQIKRVKKILLPSGSPLTGGFIWSLGTNCCPPHPMWGQQTSTGYKLLYTNHQGFPGGKPLGCPLVSTLGWGIEWIEFAQEIRWGTT